MNEQQVQVSGVVRMFGVVRAMFLVAATARKLRRNPKAMVSYLN